VSKRDARGRFQKGASGNPAGRPRSADELRRLLEGDAKKVAKKVLDAAAAGDMQACRLVLERLVPAIKPAAEPVAFELKGDSLTEQAQSVLAAVAAGELPPDQGKALIDAIGSLVKVVEQDEIRRRLELLEGTRDAQP
jgi:hypothetical protein